MKKLLRLIPALALAAALLTVTAHACSPDDRGPEQHENVIQTDEEKPSCLAGGYYVLECTVCGWRCTYSTDPAMPHSFGPWEVVPGKEPTCTKAGEKQAYCSTCNKWYETPAPATGHSWYKYYTKEPTCTTAGEYYTYCRNCNASQGRSTEPATGHFWVTWKQVFATCTTSGYTEFVCDDCGADGGTITTPAKGHSFGAWFTTTQATCMEEGIQTRECTQCGVTERRGIAKTDHSWNAGTVIVQPTTEQEGVTEWICNMCGMSRTRPISKLAPGTTAAPTTAPSASPAVSPSASPAASPSASSTAEASASPGAAGTETADKNGKGEKSGGKGDRHGAGENAAEPDDVQKNQKGDAPERTAKNGSSVGRILLLVLVPVLLIAAVVIFLLVRRKKTRQP